MSISVMKHRRTSTLLLLLAALFVVTPAIAKDTLILNFGVFSDDVTSSVVRRYMPALKSLEISLSEKLHRTVDIRLRVAQNPDQGIDNLLTGNVDVAAFTDSSYLAATQSSPKLRILAGINSMSSNTITPWVARAGMHDTTFLALQESLFNIKNSKILTSLKSFGFVQSHKAQYTNRSTEVSTNKHTKTKQRAVSQQALERNPEPNMLGAQQQGIKIKTKIENSPGNDKGHPMGAKLTH